MSCTKGCATLVGARQTLSVSLRPAKPQMGKKGSAGKITLVFACAFQAALRSAKRILTVCQKNGSWTVLDIGIAFRDSVWQCVDRLVGTAFVSQSKARVLRHAPMTASNVKTIANVRRIISALRRLEIAKVWGYVSLGPRSVPL